MKRKLSLVEMVAELRDAAVDMAGPDGVIRIPAGRWKIERGRLVPDRSER